MIIKGGALRGRPRGAISAGVRGMEVSGMEIKNGRMAFVAEWSRMASLWSNVVTVLVSQNEFQEWQNGDFSGMKNCHSCNPEFQYCDIIAYYNLRPKSSNRKFIVTYKARIRITTNNDSSNDVTITRWISHCVSRVKSFGPVIAKTVLQYYDMDHSSDNTPGE